MDEIVIDGINLFNPIEDKMDKIIDAFVDFYGEEYRTRIDNKLRNASIYFAFREGVHSLKEEIDLYYQRKLTNIEIEFWSEVLGEDASDRLKRAFTLINGNDLEAMSGALENKENSYKLENNLVYLLTILGYSMPQSFQTQSKIVKQKLREETFRAEMLEKIKKYQTVWNDKHKERYELILSSKEENSKRKYNIDNIAEELGQEYTNELVQLFEDNIAKYIVDYENINSYTRNKLIGYFIHFLSNKTFTLDYDKLNNITLFNKLGIEHSSYEEYMEDEKFKKIFNESLFSKYQGLTYKYAKKFIFSNPLLIKVLDDLNIEKQICGINSLVGAIYNYISSNFDVGGFVEGVVIDGKSRTICLLPQGLQLDDNIFFHELNHIIEGDLVKEGESYKYVSGFDWYRIDDEDTHLDADKIFNDNNKNTNQKTKGKRKYEIFNEIINDYFSEQITKNYTQKNGHIGAKIETHNSSSYRLAFPLMEDFIKENKPHIIKSKITQDHDYFARYVGQENFDRLAESVTSFLSVNDFKRAEIYNIIREKTGIKKISEIRNFLDADYKWDENEQVIIDAFKTVDDIRKSIREKQKQEAELNL